MATAAQMRALLSVTCPHCGAGPHSYCYVKSGGQRKPITSLDGRSHEARWQAALGLPARVAEGWQPPPRRAVRVSAQTRETVPVRRAEEAPDERPW